MAGHDDYPNLSELVPLPWIWDDDPDRCTKCDEPCEWSDQWGKPWCRPCWDAALAEWDNA